MDVAEDMIKYVIRAVLERCPQEMYFFNAFVDKGLLDRCATWRVPTLPGSPTPRRWRS